MTNYNNQLDLKPGISVGPFNLGNTLFNILNLLRSYKFNYPTVKVAWNELNPSISPIHLHLISPPISLQFEASSQRLIKIEVNSPTEWIKYRDKTFSTLSSSGGGGSSERNEINTGEEVIKVIRRVMGPSYSACKNGEEEVLCYPGVVFGIVSLQNQGASVLSRIIVTYLPESGSNTTSNEEETAWLNPKLPDSPSIARGDLSLAQIQLDENLKPLSLILNFHSGPITSSSSSSTSTLIQPLIIILNETTSEDLISILGSPIRIFHKEDDRMTIHTNSTPIPSNESNPYFNSYPHLGLTFLLHPLKHKIIKIILHENLPGESHFGRNFKCCFEFIQFVGTSDNEKERIRLGGIEMKGSELIEILSGSRGEENEFERKGESSSTSNGIRMKERVMELDREIDVDSSSGKNGEKSILGKMTEIHGFPGIALEITGTNDVETIWIF